MEFVMYAGNEFIASLPVNPRQLSWPGYVSGLKRELLRMHAEDLSHFDGKVEFLIVPLSSSRHQKTDAATACKA